MIARTKNNYLTANSSVNYATAGSTSTAHKPSNIKSYYATNTSSLTNSIGRKKSVTAVSRQPTTTTNTTMTTSNAALAGSHHQQQATSSQLNII